MPDGKREERLRQALRANLRKRKAQQRARAEEASGEDPVAEDGAGPEGGAASPLSPSEKPA